MVLAIAGWTKDLQTPFPPTLGFSEVLYVPWVKSPKLINWVTLGLFRPQVAISKARR